MAARVKVKYSVEKNHDKLKSSLEARSTLSVKSGA